MQSKGMTFSALTCLSFKWKESSHNNKSNIKQTHNTATIEVSGQQR